MAEKWYVSKQTGDFKRMTPETYAAADGERGTGYVEASASQAAELDAATEAPATGPVSTVATGAEAKAQTGPKIVETTATPDAGKEKTAGELAEQFGEPNATDPNAALKNPYGEEFSAERTELTGQETAAALDGAKVLDLTPGEQPGGVAYPPVPPFSVEADGGIADGVDSGKTAETVQDPAKEEKPATPPKPAARKPAATLSDLKGGDKPKGNG